MDSERSHVVEAAEPATEAAQAATEAARHAVSEPAAPPRPDDGDWYAPHDADDAPGIDYFRDDRRLIPRVFSLSLLALIVAIAVMLTGMWYAVPVLEQRLEDTPPPTIAPVASPAVRSVRSAPTTAPIAPPTTAPASSEMRMTKSE